AKEKKATFLLLDVDSPGGLVYAASNIIEALKDCSGIQTAAFISGSEYKGAYSAAAVISLATQRIVMRAGSTIGAATAIIVDNDEGVKKAAPKFQAVWRSTARSGALAGGHSPALSDAMIESKFPVACASIQGTPFFGTQEDLKKLELSFIGLYKYNKTLNNEGQILTLTGTGAREAGLACATAENLNQALDRLGLKDCTLIDFSTEAQKIVENHLKELQEMEKKVDNVVKCLKDMSKAMDGINRTRPDAQQYYVARLKDAGFVDGGKQWYEYSNKCIDYCRDWLDGAKEIVKLEKYHEELGLDEHLDMDQIKENIKKVEKFLRLLKKNKKSKTFVELGLKM
ncbi:MAG: hypothetical protein JXR97_05855, partial [Planctomycetes bacterium]|nr:hypothetical protein [Planctomycetota bacterium]